MLPLLIALFLFLVVAFIEAEPLPAQQLQTLRLSIIQDSFQYARQELLLSLILYQAQPTHLWKPCSTTILMDQPMQSSCYTQLKTAGHLFLFFSFDNQSSVRVSELPTDHHPVILSIRSPTENIATNVPARDFFYRSNNQRGAFTIPTRCHATTEEFLVITVSFLGYKFQYTQQCPKGRLDGLFMKTSHPVSPPWHAGEHDSSTELKLFVKPPLENVHIRDMRILSSRPGITAILDDDEGDFISQHNPWKTRIAYECNVYGPSSAAITLLLDVKPYEMLNKTWRKSCGADHPPEGLVLSTSPWKGDIAFNGKVLSRGYGKAIGKKTKFHVGWFDTEKGKDLFYGDIHVESASIFPTKITTDGRPLKAGKEVEWDVSVKCLWMGFTDVRILLRFRGGYVLDTIFWGSCGLGDVLTEWARCSLFFLSVLLTLLYGRIILRRGTSIWPIRRRLFRRRKRV